MADMLDKEYADSLAIPWLTILKGNPHKVEKMDEK
jgi:hypothetical protein